MVWCVVSNLPPEEAESALTTTVAGDVTPTEELVFLALLVSRRTQKLLNPFPLHYVLVQDGAEAKDGPAFGLDLCILHSFQETVHGCWAVEPWHVSPVQ